MIKYLYNKCKWNYIQFGSYICVRNLCLTFNIGGMFCGFTYSRIVWESNLTKEKNSTHKPFKSTVTTPYHYWIKVTASSAYSHMSVTSVNAYFILDLWFWARPGGRSRPWPHRLPDGVCSHTLVPCTRDYAQF